jgi:hypothetical protein
MRGQELKGEWKNRMRNWVVAALCYPWCKESEDEIRGLETGQIGLKYQGQEKVHEVKMT